MLQKESLLRQIMNTFNLSPDEAEAALLLLDTRAANLDMSLDDYMQTYHPAGFSQKDATLNDDYKGYVQFLAQDAKAIIKTGKTADFSTFVHENAHIFRRQLAGDLKAKAERAFKVEGGNWTREQEEYFAIGFEEYIRLRMAESEDLRQVFERGARCMQHIYNGLDRIVELNPEIIKVYDELFTESRFRFKQNEFEKTVKDINENSLEKFKASHVYLGMTPPIYQELGFERLPVMITARHLKSIMQDWGSDINVNYHGLTPDIIAQIPEAIKKPLIIMQSQNKEHPEDIIAVVELKDKKDRQIIVPFSPNKKGNFNDIEIDINLAKSIYGRNNFNKFIQDAFKENRILYLNKKSRDIVPPQVQYPRNYKSQLSDKSQVLASPQVQYPSNQGSQLLYDNIARYQEIVKQKISSFAKLFQAAAPEEMKTVRQKYIDTADYLKAPNGADTNLTERQWLQVRTPSFKKWFGDWENTPESASKVLDENGEPLVVYHGSRTGGDFNTFQDISFFSSDFSTADMFKSEADYSIYINDERFGDVSRSIAYDIAYGISDGYDLDEQVNTTYDLEEVQDYDAIQEAVGYFTRQPLPEAGTLFIKENAPVFECFLNFRNPKIIDYEGKAWGTGKNDVYVESDLNGLEESGYDGLIGKNIIEGGSAELRNGNVPPVSTDYVTLKANQIKSATENIGSFDMANNNILFQRSSYYSRETQKEKRSEDVNKIAGYFIKAIETNTAPWMKPWKANEYIDDFNPVTKTTYSGINSMILPFIRETEFHSSDPRWYTFNNAKEQNFMVKKGEKATPIVFYGTVPIGKDGKALAVDEEGNPIGEAVRFRSTLRFYKVFHASQLGVPQFDKDGNLLRDKTGAVISTPIEPFEQPKIEVIDFKPIAAAEKVLQQSGARIYHDQSDKSFYNPAHDSIHLCPKENYINEILYYGTALHELTHWTGAESRLNRDLKHYSVSETARAREELIAEIGSYALCKDLKLDFNPQNSAAYVQSWCEILRDKPDEIMKATHEALKARDYIQGSEHRMEKVQSIRNNVQGENNMGRGIQTDGRKSVREVGKEIWSLTNFSEGNIYGSDFETWYRECFPYTIHTAADNATEKILKGDRRYKDGSFIEMEAWEAKDGKPHTFFFDKEHFVEYYGEQKAKRLFDTDLRNEQKSFQLTQFLTAEMLQTDRSISTEPEAIKKATIERIDKRMEYIDADMQDFKKDAKYEVPEEYYESVVHDFQMDIDYFDDLKKYCKNMPLEEFAAHPSVKQVISAKQCLEELDKKDSAKSLVQQQPEFDFSGTPCYNPATGKIYAAPEFENHVQAIRSNDKRYLPQNEIVKFGFTVESDARPILLKTEKVVAGKIKNNYELLYNGKDIKGLPPPVEKEKTAVRKPVHSIAVQKEKDFGMEIG